MRENALKRNGRWPVMMVYGDDVEICDKQTFEETCDCGATLELLHLQDMDTLRIWYGGACGQCGYTHDIERGGDELHCRDCDTPLRFVSEDEFEDHMYCPVCAPIDAAG